MGIIYSWIYYLKGFRVIYINYLPLWNPIPFVTLPPNSVLGPITGSVFIRKKIFEINIRNTIFLFFIL